MENSNVIFLSNVRLSFPHLTEPQKTVNQLTGSVRVSYNAEFIMPESHLGYQQFMRRFAELAAVKGKENAAALMQMIMADRKARCFGRGEEKVNKNTFIPFDGYAGGVYISAGSDRQPQVIQADGSPVDPTNTMAYQALTRNMYGGCKVNVAIKPWWQSPNAEKQYGHGIRCDLVAIQFAGDDTPFGEGTPDVKGLFGAVAQTSAAAGMFGASAAPADLPSFFK